MFKRAWAGRERASAVNARGDDRDMVNVVVTEEWRCLVVVVVVVAVVSVNGVEMNDWTFDVARIALEPMNVARLFHSTDG